MRDTPPALGIDNWMVAWTPGQPTAVKVGPWPDRQRWSDKYDSTTGCCEDNHQGDDLDRKIALMFIDFHTLVVGDSMDPQAVHREFLKIDEYRRRISPDIDGADRGEDA